MAIFPNMDLSRNSIRKSLLSLFATASAFALAAAVHADETNHWSFDVTPIVWVAG